MENISECNERICILALIGIPAAGKTTFCGNLLTEISQFNIVHFCFDDFFEMTPNGENRKILQHIQFKDNRQTYLQEIESIVGLIKLKKPFEFSNFQYTIKSAKSNDWIIICDDNNYYTGMRYKIYQICKKWQISFGQIYFPINLEVALQRNSLRTTNYIPPNVIQKMHKRLEAPAIEKNHWESKTYTIETVHWDDVVFFINHCLQIPIKFHLATSGVNMNQPTAKHRLDLLLRRRIKEILEKTETQNVKRKASELNQRRIYILNNMKRETIPAFNGLADDFDNIIEFLR